MHLPTIVFLVPACVCAVSWLGLVPTGLVPDGGLLGLLTRLGAGAAAASVGIFVLGRAHLLHVGVLVALTLAAAAGGLWSLRGRRLPLPRAGRFHDLLLALVGLALLLDLVAATAPPTSADALKYHLALPKLWLQLGSVGDPFWRWEGFNPSGIEMLYTQALALGGGSAAAAVHALFALACAAALYGLAHELTGRREAGAAAASLFTLQGIVTWEATSAFVELGLTFYAVLATWHAWRWWVAPSRARAVWVGVLAGAAAGTKYIGLAVAALVLAPLLRRPWHALAGAGAAAAFGGAWYLRNALATGNPVYPLAFGGRWLTPYAHREIHDSYAGYGVHGGVLRVALLPFDLVVHGSAFDRGRYVDVALFVLALLGALVVRGPMLVLAAAVVVYLVAWRLESQQARFLLPALALLAVAAGAGAAGWWELGGARRAALVAVLGVAAVAWLASSAALTRQLVPVAFGAESRPAFLQRLTGTYDALRAARAQAGGTLGLVNYPYTLDVPGRAYSLDVPEFVPTLSRAQYLARLRSLGVRAIVGGDGDSDPVLAPVRSCLTRLAVFPARLVTSRALGKSVPFDLDLYSFAGCA